MIFGGANRVPPTDFIFGVMQNNSIDFRHFDSVDSTNELASSILNDEKVMYWTVVSTDTQTKGRGQRGTTWQDEPGKNLLMSIISPLVSWPADRSFELNMAVSHAVYSSLSDWIDVKLKWPNDLYTNSGKLGGILLEPSVRGGYIQRVIIGLGINVRQTQWPLDFKATSMSLEVASPPEIKVLRMIVARAVVRSVERLLLTGQSFKPEYLSACMAYKQWREYQTGDTTFKAMFTDIAPTGQLILERETGERSSYDLKEVRLLDLRL